MGSINYRASNCGCEMRSKGIWWFTNSAILLHYPYSWIYILCKQSLLFIAIKNGLKLWWGGTPLHNRIRYTHSSFIVRILHSFSPAAMHNQCHLPHKFPVAVGYSDSNAKEITSSLQSLLLLSIQKNAHSYVCRPLIAWSQGCRCSVVWSNLCFRFLNYWTPESNKCIIALNDVYEKKNEM